MNCFLRLELGNTFFVCVVFEQSPVAALLISEAHIPACAPSPAPRDAASPRIHVKNNSIVFQLGPALFLAAWRHRSGSWEVGGGGRPWTGFLLARSREQQQRHFCHSSISIIISSGAHTHTPHLGQEISSFTEHTGAGCKASGE